jgi:hypothetical protein
LLHAAKKRVGRCILQIGLEEDGNIQKPRNGWRDSGFAFVTEYSRSYHFPSVTQVFVGTKTPVYQSELLPVLVTY